MCIQKAARVVEYKPMGLSTLVLTISPAPQTLFPLHCMQYFRRWGIKVGSHLMQAKKSVRISNMSVYLPFLLCSCSTFLFWTLHLPNITVSLASVVFKLSCITEKRSKTLSSLHHKAVKTYGTVQGRIHTFSPNYIKVSSTFRWIVSFTLFPLHPLEK